MTLLCHVRECPKRRQSFCLNLAFKHLYVGCQVAPINCDFSGTAERLRLIVCRLIADYHGREFHHYSRYVRFCGWCSWCGWGGCWGWRGWCGCSRGKLWTGLFEPRRSIGLLLVDNGRKERKARSVLKPPGITYSKFCPGSSLRRARAKQLYDSGLDQCWKIIRNNSNITGGKESRVRINGVIKMTLFCLLLKLYIYFILCDIPSFHTTFL